MLHIAVTAVLALGAPIPSCAHPIHTQAVVIAGGTNMVVAYDDEGFGRAEHVFIIETHETLEPLQVSGGAIVCRSKHSVALVSFVNGQAVKVPQGYAVVEQWGGERPGLESIPKLAAQGAFRAVMTREEVATAQGKRQPDPLVYDRGDGGGGDGGGSCDLDAQVYDAIQCLKGMCRVGCCPPEKPSLGCDAQGRPHCTCQPPQN